MKIKTLARFAKSPFIDAGQDIEYEWAWLIYESEDVSAINEDVDGFTVIRTLGGESHSIAIKFDEYYDKLAEVSAPIVICDPKTKYEYEE